MVKLLWAIAKDGLKALAFWLVASVVMIYLWGYAGRMLSIGLGLIFIVSFIGANLKRIVVSVQSSSGRSAGILPPPFPVQGQSQAQPGTPNTVCTQCGGAGRTTCYGCNGSGYRYDGVQNSLCFICSGQRSFVCTTCSGSGMIYR